MRRNLPYGFLFAFIAFSLQTHLRAESDWPQFRGPEGQGHSTATGLPITWSEEENIVWKTPIPGRGWSSPVIQDGKIWLTTSFEQKATPEQREKRLADVPNAGRYELSGRVDFFVICLSAETGRILYRQKLIEENEPGPVHSLNTYASPTPIVTEDRLYCHFGTYGTVCFDLESRQVVWQRRLLHRHFVGPGSSPVLYKNLLILVCDGADVQYVEALDIETGKTVWHQDRPPLRTEKPDFKKSYATPLVIRSPGRDQCVAPGAQWIISYEPTSGKELWRFDHGEGFSLVPRPVFDGRHVFVCTGFGRQSLLAIRTDGVGDVTATHVDWEETKQVPAMSSPVWVDGRIYMISEKGIATCLDADSGEKVWRERISGNYSASPLFAEGRIYFSSREGVTTVIAPGETFQELARNQLNGPIMASPAVVQSDLVFRTETHLYRIGN